MSSRRRSFSSCDRSRSLFRSIVHLLEPSFSTALLTVSWTWLKVRMLSLRSSKPPFPLANTNRAPPKSAHTPYSNPPSSAWLPPDRYPSSSEGAIRDENEHVHTSKSTTALRRIDTCNSGETTQQKSESSSCVDSGTERVSIALSPRSNAKPKGFSTASQQALI